MGTRSAGNFCKIKRKIKEHKVDQAYTDNDKNKHKSINFFIEQIFVRASVF